MAANQTKAFDVEGQVQEGEEEIKVFDMPKEHSGLELPYWAPMMGCFPLHP